MQYYDQQQQSSKIYKIFQRSFISDYLRAQYQTKYITINSLDKFTIVSKNDPDRKKYIDIFNYIKSFKTQHLGLNQKESYLVAVMMGLGIGDALGSSTEFSYYRKNGYKIFNSQKGLKGFKAIKKAVDQKIINPRFKEYKSINNWTDDTSMALCLAYSLIIKNWQFNPNHSRCLYYLWWNLGLANGGLEQSVGLGGNIAISLKQFEENYQSQYAEERSKNNNGNGSLMRLAPIPIAFHDNIEKAIYYAQKQSLTTHNGQEAKQCCKLLTLIIINLVNRQNKQKQLKQGWQKVIQQTGKSFKSQVKSVECLAKSQQQTQDMFNQSCRKDPMFKQFNENLKDRNWNWKDKDFEYSPSRNDRNPGYIGSYCMDALSMALHIVWTTNSFRQCVQKAADMGGDADTVGAITGQITGAIYGFDDEMFQLYSEMKDFQTKTYQLFLVSLKLAKGQQLNQTTLSYYKMQLNRQTYKKGIQRILSYQYSNYRRQYNVSCELKQQNSFGCIPKSKYKNQTSCQLI